jgi:hypothetical protein
MWTLQAQRAAQVDTTTRSRRRRSWAKSGASRSSSLASRLSRFFMATNAGGAGQKRKGGPAWSRCESPWSMRMVDIQRGPRSCERTAPDAMPNRDVLKRRNSENEPHPAFGTSRNPLASGSWRADGNLRGSRRCQRNRCGSQGLHGGRATSERARPASAIMAATISVSIAAISWRQRRTGSLLVSAEGCPRFV